MEDSGNQKRRIDARWRAKATPAQVALAWLLQQDGIAVPKAPRRTSTTIWRTSLKPEESHPTVRNEVNV